MVDSIDWRKDEHQKHLRAALQGALTILHDVEKSGQLDSWLTKVLVGLIQTTGFSYTNLTSGWKIETISLCAWAARTLVEAEVWMQYVTLSNVNAKRFYDDWANDVSDLLEASTPYGEMNPQQQSDMSLIYGELIRDQQRANETHKMLDTVRESSGLEDEDYLRVTSVARELGHGEWFSKYNKILSKYVHATAVSVLSFPTPKARTNLANFLLYNGSNSTIIVLGSSNDFLKNRTLPAIF